MRTVVLLALVALQGLSGCQLPVKHSPHPAEPQPSDSIPLTDTPYQRKDWPHWINDNKNCRNTRQELLIATSRAPVQFRDARQCTVKTGLWIGPYTGRTFTRASDVDIDHIVPLAHAHRHGASSWTRAQRRIFANDFENLLVVDDATNQAKSDKAPHEWLPPDKTFWCEYGRRWQRVKDKYRLLFSAAERYVLKQLADTCLQ